MTYVRKSSVGTRLEAAPPGAERALARCLGPVSPDEFFATSWERRPLLVPGRGEGFDDLFSVADVERLVCSTGARYPAFRLVKAGTKLQARDYTVDVPWRPVPFAGTANPERIAAEFDQGATIVLQGLHLHWPPLAAFSRRLEACLGERVQANAYYTPRESQGLPVHHDTHDVFVLQVAGEKRWLVYEPVLELPLRDQRYGPEHGEPGDAVLDLALRPGDVLYLPRGWLHQALTSATDSLHLTIGVNAVTWLDAARAVLDSCADDVEFRRSARSGGDPDDLLHRLRERLTPAEIAGVRRSRLVRSRRPLLEGQLSQIRAAATLDLDTLVERRDTVIADLVGDGERLVLAFEGKEVAFPPYVAEQLEFICAADDRFRPAALPGALDEAGRLVLVRRLVREGFLAVRSPE